MNHVLIIDRWLRTGTLSNKRKSENDGLHADENKKENILEMKTPTIISPEADKSTSELLIDTNMIQKYNLDVTRPEIWSYSQYSEFKDKYTWLISLKGKFGCDFCSAVKSLGVLKCERLHISEEWINCLIEATGKIVPENYLTSAIQLKSMLTRKVTN